MKDYIKPSLNKKPDSVILHSETNDTRDRTTSQIVENINNICNQIKNVNPESAIIISEPIAREDRPEAKTKIVEVNRLKQLEHF